MPSNFILFDEINVKNVDEKIFKIHNISQYLSQYPIKYCNILQYDFSGDIHPYYFTMSLSKNFHPYRDVTIASEGLQSFGISSALRAFEQVGIFIVPQLQCHDLGLEMQGYTTSRYDTYHGIPFTIRYVSRYTLWINQSD
jgi:hypothetical protein